MKRNLILFVLGAVLLFVGIRAADAGEKSSFSRSLHATGEGMRYWYEEAGGFMSVTGIPYKKLDCKNCHISSCDKCHAEQDKKKGTCSYSVAKAQKTETCLQCHGREGLTYKMCKAKNKLDVHAAKDISCSECHAKDVHGDGKSYTSMRSPGAVKAKCTKCHEDTKGRHHTVHKRKLACAACHVENTIACMNCHMDSFLKTGKRKGNFVKMHDWLLLMNYEGKVTSATAMTLIYKDKKFICYAPYFTHAVQPKGKACNDCHDNKAVKIIGKGKKVPMMKFENGKVVTWKGVVPIVKGQLEWVYLNKTRDGGWTPVKGDHKEVVQYVGYGKPLNKAQLKKLAAPKK